MLRSSIIRAFVVVGFVASSTTVGEAVPPPTVAVTTCGQEVPRGTIGYLTGDLDCSGFVGGGIEGMAVILHTQATLELRGFTLTASKFGVGCYEPGDDPTVYVNVKRCGVVGGGGAITNASGYALSGGNGKLDVADTVFSGSAVVLFNFRDVRLRNVIVTGNERPLWAVDVARLEGSTVSNNTVGLGATRIKLFGSSAVDNGSFDVSSVRRPVVKKGSACGVAIGSGGTVWDVCRAN